MNREHINEYKNRFRLYDDDAKPLTGSDNQYTRLAIIGFRPERGGERHFTLFAQSTKLFDAIGKSRGSDEWVHQGFEKKWMYIEEILRKPGPGDTIEGYLQLVNHEDLWQALYEYLKETGIMDRFSKSIKATSYGLPRESQAKIGLPNDLPANIKLIVPPKEFKL